MRSNAFRSRAPVAFTVLMLALLGALLMPRCSAQVATVANPSTQRQVRWCVVPMPLSQAAALPAACVVAGRYPAFKAQALGVTTQLWHVRCDVPALGTITLVDWRPLVGPVPAFALSPWITDAPARSVLRLGIYEGGAWRSNIQLDRVPPTLVASSPVAQTWEFRDCTQSWSPVRGYSITMWATFWLGQDAVDVEGVVVWSDPTDPSWRKENVRLTLQTGAWPTVGERLALYAARPNGFTSWDDHSWNVLNGSPLPHGVGVAWRGVLLPADDGPVPVTWADQQAHLLDAERARLEAAAAEAPLVAACDWTQSQADWMAFGRVPATTARADRAAVLSAANAAGSYFAPRPYANGANHGGTGEQPPFGALKDLVALQGDPWRVYELQDSALDYWRRGFHHRELDGRRVTRATRPGLQTWQGSIEPKMSPDTMGKPRADAPYGWDQVGGRSILADDQHRGDAYELCAYALSGSPLLLECIRDVLAVDEMRAMPSRGWFDGPRATGRLMQSWAKVSTITSGTDRDLAVRLGLAELADRQADQDRWAYSPVRVVEWKEADPRVLSGCRFSVPWNDSLCVLGLVEEAAACRRLGRTEDAARFTALATYLGTSIVKWSSVTDTRDGSVLPINGLKWNDGGAANPPAYYVYPREGAATDAARDMLVGSLGWWPWFSGSLSIAQDQTADAETRAQAAAIWQRMLQGADVKTLEWSAVR